MASYWDSRFIIENQTDYYLKYRGAYYNSGKVPLGDVRAGETATHYGVGSRFSMAWLFTINGTYLTLAASCPSIGCDKIAAKFDKDRYKVWDDMDDGDDKDESSGDYRVKAKLDKSNKNWKYTISYSAHFLERKEWEEQMAEFQTMKTNLETLEEQKEKWDNKWPNSKR